MYRITILEGPDHGRHVPVGEGDFILGRGADCHLRLDDPAVEPRHASILVKEDEFVLLNEASETPLAVNGHAVKLHHLHHGDVLTVGGYRLLFHHVEPAGAPTEKRVFSLVHLGAILTAAAILAIQFAFLIGFPIWQGRTARAVEGAHTGDAVVMEPEPVPAPEPAPEPEPAPNPLGAPDWIADLMRGGTPVEDGAGAEPPHAEDTLSDTNLQVRVHAMMAEAEGHISAGRYEEAHAVYVQLSDLAPGYLPAHMENARLFELRGMPDKAAEAWATVRDRTERPLLRDQAEAEVQRLTAASVAARTGEAPPPRLEGRLRIADVERTRFQRSTDYDEMRLLQIAIRARAGEEAIRLEDIKLYVEFYDRLEDGSLVPTTARTSPNPQALQGPWAVGETLRVTASYVVPNGGSAERPGRSYGGYRIYMYLDGVLQDENAAPLSLLGEPMFKPL